MADDYTPTIAQVRVAYAAGTCGKDDSTKEWSAATERFDAWLTAHDREQRAAIVKALRDTITEIDEDCPHPADQHPEGNCQVCDYAVAVGGTLEELADRIEAGYHDAE